MYGVPSCPIEGPATWMAAELTADTSWVLHMRTEFTDFDEPERKRHLLRIWLSLPNNHELSPLFATYFGSVAAGALRGGYPSRDGGRSFRTT